MNRHLLSFAGTFLLPLLFSSIAAASDWSAFSTIEKDTDGKSYRETVVLVNESAKTVTLSMPNFQFPGHGDTPAESLSPMGDIVLAPGEAVSFVHIIPMNRTDGFATSMGIQDVNENIPITQHMLKESFGAK